MEAAAAQPAATPHTVPRTREPASTAAADFVGDDVLFAGGAPGTGGRVRGLTWNARQAFDGATRDAFLTYVAAQDDARGERPGYDFCAVQEPGRAWREPGMKWMWESKIVAQADCDAEWRRCGSAGRRKRWKKKHRRLDPGVVQVVSRRAGWRASNTDKVVLMWTKAWADRQMGSVVKTEDGRTVGAKFSTGNGAIGVVAHYGVPSPKQAEVDTDSAERNSANSVAQLLTVVDGLRATCKMVILLGDLNTQRAGDRLDSRSGANQGVAEVLWRRTVEGGSFVSSADALGHDGVWTRRGTKSDGSVIRTRPDWCLVTADWSRWRIARCGVHQLNHSLLNSDHFPLGVEVVSIRRDVGGAMNTRAVTGQPYDATKATPEQLAEWDAGLQLLQWEEPTNENWDASGRSFYETFVADTTALAQKVFGRPRMGSGRRRPFWDRKAGIALREMAVLRGLRADLRRLTGRSGEAARLARSRVVRRARRHNNFPPEISVDDDGRLLSRLDAGIRDRREGLRLRSRRKRMAGARRIAELWGAGKLGQVVRLALRRKTNGRDPYAAIVMGDDGEPMVTAEPSVLKQAAQRVAADWFTSIKNPGRYRICWRRGVGLAQQRQVLREMRGRTGWRCWSGDPLAQAAAAGIRQQPGIQGADGLCVLTTADCKWLQGHADAVRVEHHSSPYTVWFRPSAGEEARDAAVAAARALLDECGMEPVSGSGTTEMGAMISLWMSMRQRAAVAGCASAVLAVMPLPPQAFFANTAAAEAGLPEAVAAAFDLRRLRDAAPAGRHYVDPAKRAKFDEFMAPRAFKEAFHAAWRAVRKKAAAGYDGGVKRLFDGCARVKMAMAEYMRIAVMRMDLSPLIARSVLKWLPKDGNKTPYLDMISCAPPNKRPIGLNTLWSKVLELVLARLQRHMNTEEESAGEFMFAWFRGRSAYTAAMINLLIAEDADARAAEVHTMNFDAYHWYDTVHLATSVMTERRLGYPPELIYAKAAIRSGEIWVRTEAGLAGPVYVEQGLGQGRVDAPADSNRYDAGVMSALGACRPYQLHADGAHALPVAMIHYADDRNAYSGSRSGLNNHARRMVRVQLHDGGAFKARKCFQRRARAVDDRPLDPIWDPTQGSEWQIPDVGPEAPKRFLGHYSDLAAKSEHGATLLQRECRELLGHLARPSVPWPAFKSIVSSVNGGKVRYKSTLTRGMSRAVKRIQHGVTTAALHKLGERSTSASAPLYAKQGPGAGLASMVDIRTIAVIKEQVAALRGGGVGQQAIRGAMEACALRRGGADAWDRLLTPNAVEGAGGDASVPARTHAALSSVGLVVRRARRRDRHSGYSSGGGDRCGDGGRWADWRLADVLPPATWHEVGAWCRKHQIFWLGQLSSPCGRRTTTLQRWLRRCGVSDEPPAALTLHRAVVALRCGEGHWVSPLNTGMQAAQQTLAVGQLALVDEPDRDDASHGEDSYALVQGVDERGLCGGHWQPGGTGWHSTGCEDCRMGICHSLSHAPAAPRWNAEAGAYELPVRVLQRVYMDGSDELSQVFFPEGAELTTVRLPALLYPVEPRLIRAGDATRSSGVVPVMPARGYDQWMQGGTVLAAGRPMTQEEWHGTRRERSIFADEEAAGRQWRCELCGLGEMRATCRRGGYHLACHAYHERWDEYRRGGAHRWVYRGSAWSLRGLDMPGLPDGALVFATDGSAKDGRGAGGGIVSAGCAVVQGGASGPELLIQLQGRPQEIAVSYYAELAGLIVLHHVAADDVQHTWVGDNESVVKLYKRIAWDGWQFTESDLEYMPARTLVRWLIKLVAARRVPFIAVHQVSHLSVATEAQRRSDHRVLLARADVAAERARSSEVHILNISGSHPGVDEYAVYEQDTGWRIDDVLAKVVAARCDEKQMAAWTRLPVQGRFLRVAGRDLDAMDWDCGARGLERDRAFASKYMRMVVPTSVHRARHCRTEGGASVIDKYGWSGALEGQYVEILTAEGAAAVWSPAALGARSTWSNETAAVVHNTKRLEVHVSTLRDGRWVPHTMACVFGDSLEDQDWETADLLLRGLEAHVRQIASAVTAVLTAERYKAAVGVEPYAWSVAQAVRSSGREARAAEIERLQDAVQRYVEERLLRALHASEDCSLTPAEMMVVAELPARRDCGAVSMTSRVRELSVRATRRDGDTHMLADLVHDTENVSRLDLRLLRFIRVHEVGIAAVADWLDECPGTGASDEYERWGAEFGRPERRLVAWQPDKRREAWAESCDGESGDGLRRWRVSRPLELQRLATALAVSTHGLMESQPLLAVDEVRGWKHWDMERQVGREKLLGDGRKERKMAVVGSMWRRRAVSVTDWLMRRWLQCGGNAAPAAALRSRPWSRRHTMRNQFLQLLMFAAGGDAVPMGVTVWNPYLLPRAGFAGADGRPCAVLRITSGRPRSRVFVIGVSPATAADVRWAVARRAPTLLMRCGRICAGEHSGECLAALGPGGYSPEHYRAAVAGASRTPRACKLHEAVRFIAFGVRQVVKDKLQAALRLATERYGDAKRAAWPYCPGPRPRGDAQVAVRGGGALAMGVAAAYPRWRTGVVVRDMRRAVKERWVPARLVGAALRAWHRQIIRARRLEWQRDGTAEGTLRRVNGLDTVAASVARRKRDMAMWRRGAARGQERQLAAASAMTAAQRDAAERHQLRSDLARWAQAQTAMGRAPKAPPADLLIRAGEEGAGGLAEQVQRAIGGGGSKFATVTFVGFSLEGGALSHAMALVEEVAHLRLVRCWGLHGERVAAVLQDSELSKLTVDSCDSPDWGVLDALDWRTELVVRGDARLRGWAERHRRRRGRKRAALRRRERGGASANEGFQMVRDKAVRALDARALRRLARVPTAIALVDAIGSSVRVTAGDWRRLYPGNEAQLWVFMGFALRRQRRYDAYMSVASRSWRDGPALRVDAGGAVARRRHMLSRMITKAVAEWPAWRDFESVVDAAVRRLDELRPQGSQLGDEPEAAFVELARRLPDPEMVNGAVDAYGRLAASRSFWVPDDATDDGGDDAGRRNEWRRTRRLSTRISNASAMARRPRPRDAPQCTAGHDLGLQRRRDKGPVTGLYCDACGDTIVPGVVFWACGKCEEDYCDACRSPAAVAPPVATRTTADGTTGAAGGDDESAGSPPSTTSGSSGAAQTTASPSAFAGVRRGEDGTTTTTTTDEHGHLGEAEGRSMRKTSAAGRKGGR